ncbi:hypothetical protein RSPO_m00342 (plasmid) [Ralstonia solanacearum Po82]|uniref:Uncharacterized protein n=1 Tax=Ralstonia solanacearum (strain Po82) TaxID=1031711 RepID=F6G8F4_RALS8|nr:hypothetical protein RSPO_m00342 [Ralstonia solanacearum Po82]
MRCLLMGHSAHVIGTALFQRCNRFDLRVGALLQPWQVF